MAIVKCARLGDITNLGETLIHPQQHTVFLKGIKMCVSGLKPLATNTPGEGYQSVTNGSSYCTNSQARVFIKGDAMVHHRTFLDSDVGHYVNKPGTTGDDQCYVAYPD